MELDSSSSVLISSNLALTEAILLTTTVVPRSVLRIYDIAEIVSSSGY